MKLLDIILGAIRNKIRQIKEAKDQFVKDYKYIQMLEEKYKDSKHLSPKELMEKETEWECLEILALEDLYTVRHMKGKKYGLESYFVMLGVQFSADMTMKKMPWSNGTLG